MDRNQSEPFFVYYPMVLVHDPFVATPDTIGDAPRTQAANKAPRNAKAKKANFAQLAFSNAAPDVDEEALPFLFDRFYRVSDARTREHHEHPSGLGLSIVKQLCLASQGNAGAALEDGRLVITVDLPLKKGK